MLREAAVAVIRVKTPEIAYLIVQRAFNPRDPWSGHFAFPGGRREPHGRDLLAACIRETREECGFELPESALLGSLPPTEAGNHLGHPVPVTPYLFELAETPFVTLDPAECAGYHWVPESRLRDVTNHSIITPVPDRTRRFPAVQLGNGHIWGFTYRVLADLLNLPHDAKQDT